MTTIEEQMGKELEKLKEKVNILEKEVTELRVKHEDGIIKVKVDIMDKIRDVKKKEQQIHALRQYVATNRCDPSNYIDVRSLLELIETKTSLVCPYIQTYNVGGCRPPFYCNKTWMACATPYEVTQLAICVYNHWSEDISLLLCPGCYIRPKKVEDFNKERLLKTEEIYRTKSKLETQELSYLHKIRKVIEVLNKSLN
ncbi:MAG: hypothetical protein EBS19_14660 [Spirochaetia bacterium]|nr:hypothetical protein [Spirochaetia bacterium]